MRRKGAHIRSLDETAAKRGKKSVDSGQLMLLYDLVVNRELITLLLESLKFFSPNAVVPA